MNDADAKRLTRRTRRRGCAGAIAAYLIWVRWGGTVDAHKAVPDRGLRNFTQNKEFRALAIRQINADGAGVVGPPKASFPRAVASERHRVGAAGGAVEDRDGSKREAAALALGSEAGPPRLVALNRETDATRKLRANSVHRRTAADATTIGGRRGGSGCRGSTMLETWERSLHNHAGAEAEGDVRVGRRGEAGGRGGWLQADLTPKLHSRPIPLSPPPPLMPSLAFEL